MTADGTFAGYASLFGVADLGRDVVAPGAFAQSLARRGAAGVRMLWQHDPAEPIGVWLSLAEDRRGLHVAAGSTSPSRGRGKRTLCCARARSTACRSAFASRRRGPTRRPGSAPDSEIDLWEISLVTFPMLPGARVIAVKRSTPVRGERARLAFAIRRASRRLLS